jgi:N-acetylneuraminic acid mutarotase
MSTTKLPRKLGSHSVLYDGNDSIYIMGGFYGSYLDDILVFSISSQNITRIGSLPSKSFGGMMEWDNFGNIFYFGGGFYDGKQVYKFDPVTRISSEMAQLPYDVRWGASIKQNNSSNTVYILGGREQGKELLSFDMKSLTFSRMTNLSF